MCLSLVHTGVLAGRGKRLIEGVWGPSPGKIVGMVI